MTFTPTDLEVEGAAGGETAGHPAPSSPPAQRRRLVRAFLRDRTAVACGVYIVLIILMALTAPLLVKLSGWGPYEFDQSAVDPNLGGLPLGWGGGMGAEHWFGVEPGNGRDIFARIVYGARVSMTIALAATVLTSVLGVVFGLVAGYFGGPADFAAILSAGSVDAVSLANNHTSDYGSPGLADTRKRGAPAARERRPCGFRWCQISRTVRSACRWSTT